MSADEFADINLDADEEWEFYCDYMAEMRAQDEAAEAMYEQMVQDGLVNTVYDEEVPF